MKVRLPTLGIFYYPDLAVTCNDPDKRANEDYILHPKLIIEVLSDSTEAFDRGDKFADYKTISDSLVFSFPARLQHFMIKLTNYCDV